MRVAEFLPARPDLLWQLAAQMGVRYAICKCAPELTGMNPPWDIDALREIQRRFRDAGFTLYGLEGDQFDMQRIKLGREGRDEDIVRYCRMLRNMGELGIPLLCYNFMAGIGWHRSGCRFPTRGGALTTCFHLTDVPDTLTAAGLVSAERMWEHYAWFLERVLPVAEEAGVRLGMHPDDPPVPSLRGIARILSSPEGVRRALRLSGSSSHGVTYCQANFKLLGADHEAMIPELGNRIVFVHFRDVEGTAEVFHETFHDDGPTDMPRLIQLYHQAGFTGPIRVDHVPTMAGEANDRPGYAVLGRLFAVGYLKGILQTLNIPIEEH